MSRSAKNMTKLEAVEYIKKVQKRLEDKKEKFEEFLRVVSDYRHKRMNVGSVVLKVEEVLEDHRDLILGLNQFLPKGYEILLLPKGAVQMEDAIKYVKKIKDRFEDKDDTYMAFVKILTDRTQNGMSIAEVFNEVEKLFEGHRDLVRDFTLFLPSEDA